MIISENMFGNSHGNSEVNLNEITGVAWSARECENAMTALRSVDLAAEKVLSPTLRLRHTSSTLSSRPYSGLVYVIGPVNTLGIVYSFCEDSKDLVNSR